MPILYKALQQGTFPPADLEEAYPLASLPLLFLVVPDEEVFFFRLHSSENPIRRPDRGFRDPGECIPSRQLQSSGTPPDGLPGGLFFFPLFRKPSLCSMPFVGINSRVRSMFFPPFFLLCHRISGWLEREHFSLEAWAIVSRKLLAPPSIE